MSTSDAPYLTSFFTAPWQSNGSNLCSSISIVVPVTVSNHRWLIQFLRETASWLHITWYQRNSLSSLIVWNVDVFDFCLSLLIVEEEQCRQMKIESDGSRVEFRRHSEPLFQVQQLIVPRESRRVEAAREENRRQFLVAQIVQTLHHHHVVNGSVGWGKDGWLNVCVYSWLNSMTWSMAISLKRDELTNEHLCLDNLVKWDKSKSRFCWLKENRHPTWAFALRYTGSFDTKEPNECY